MGEAERRGFLGQAFAGITDILRSKEVSTLCALIVRVDCASECAINVPVCVRTHASTCGVVPSPELLLGMACVRPR